MSDDSACVTFDGVGKQFDTTWVFRDLSLSLPSGVVVAIVGESGSGKTTLLQLVNGVHRPDEGTVHVLGEPIPHDQIEKFRRGIGYAVQGAALFPHMTIRDNISLLPRIEGWDSVRIEQRVKDLLGLMSLDTELQDRYPYQLSGGQQQRVGLCRSIVLEPKVLLLDEPFSAIDPMNRADIHDEFTSLQASQGISTLLVTHDVREAVSLGKYLVVMANGQVMQHGDTKQVLDKPEETYVKPLLDRHL